ncbi:MAG: hypothetical protein KatS3mg127_1539 [Silanimonas sp.]|nr:MAG: hypothetical protein KatS3mg127_1539 [Silanimonas sp.]
MTLRERLRSLFLPRRQWLGPELLVVQPGGWFGPLEIIIPRSQCIYRRLSFPQVPVGQRFDALALAADRAAPEPGSGWVARWQGEVAHLWIFPPSVQKALDPAAVAMAESALVPPPSAEDAERLLDLREGVEGQVWRAGRLQASRWWPAPPGETEWQRFLRSAGVSSGGEMPGLTAGTLAPHPWGLPAQRLVWSPAQVERGFWRLVAVIAGLTVGWQFAAWGAWSIAVAWQSAKLDDLRSKSAPLIEARERAEALHARIERLAALLAGPSDYVLIADLKRRLPADARLVSWLRDAASLRVTMRTRERDPRVFVQALSNHPLLQSVQVNPAERGADLELLFDLPATVEGAP